MKTPTYALAQPIEYSDPSNPHDPPKQFASGTLVFVFWSDHWLTKERREELAKARGEVDPDKAHQGHWMYNPPKPNKNLVMCIIGTTWLAIDKSNIRKID